MVASDKSTAPAKADLTAYWVVELNCDCPHCGESVNLLDAPDFWDGRILRITEHDTANSNNLEVFCPDCAEEFSVCCVY